MADLSDEAKAILITDVTIDMAIKLAFKISEIARLSEEEAKEKAEKVDGLRDTAVAGVKERMEKYKSKP